MKIGVDPMTFLPSIEWGDPNDFLILSSIWRKLFPQKTEFINYDPDWLKAFYDQLVVLESPDRKIFAPYEVIHDYRKNPIDNWGNYLYKGEFDFPSKLAVIKRNMVDRFREDKLVSKGDNTCPRVKSVTARGSNLLLEIQKACYFDQVATNLSLDFVHGKNSNTIISGNTRQWDIKQSSTREGYLPKFEDSQLANTIGVALGITARNKRGQKMILMRRRTSTVAVYGKMWHLPFSFALNFDVKKLTVNSTGSLIDLMKPDFRHEQADELGLEPTDIDFYDVQPLYFCRDLARGGKPQFFLDLEVDITYEEIINKISERQGSKNEFEAETIGMTLEMTREKLEKAKHEFSPELLAYIVAKTHH